MTPANLWSHTVFVCPGFECNARMDRSFMLMTYRCVNGHEWTEHQIYNGDLHRPWRGHL